MFNSRVVNYSQRSDAQTITGNGNQINIRDCSNFQFTLTGNGNQIIVKNSALQLNVVGNGNMITAQSCQGSLSLTGNGNNCNLGRSQIAVKRNTGNGNMITGGRRVEERGRERERERVIERPVHMIINEGRRPRRNEGQAFRFGPQNLINEMMGEIFGGRRERERGYFQNPFRGSNGIRLNFVEQSESNDEE